MLSQQFYTRTVHRNPSGESNSNVTFWVRYECLPRIAYICIIFICAIIITNFKPRVIANNQQHLADMRGGETGMERGGYWARFPIGKFVRKFDGYSTIKWLGFFCGTALIDSIWCVIRFSLTFSDA